MLNKETKKLIEKLPDDVLEALSEFKGRVDVWRRIPSRDENDDQEVLRGILFFYRNVIPKAFPDFKEPPHIVELSGFKQLDWIDQKLNFYFSKITQRDMEEEIKKVTNKFDLELENSFGLAKLNSEEKENIHRNISKIRKIITDSEMPDRKKNALFERLSALSEEVDLHGTKTDRFFAFMADAAFAASNMTKNAKPFLDEVKDMIKTVGRSRARQEGVSLPPGDEVLQLPPPKES